MAGTRQPDAADVPRVVLTALWALSGFCVLTLETVWIRELALRTGNTAVASTLVVAVFFATAALGNLVGARLVARRPAALRYYGRFETVSALAACLAFIANRWVWSRGDVLPETWLGQLAAALVLVGLPSFFSGASFPGLAETFVEDARHRTSTGGRFYGFNLLGAALGVSAGGVWLPCATGLSGAFAIAAALQLAGGLLAWRCAANAAFGTRSSLAGATATPPLPNGLGWPVLAASGVLSLAVQSLLIVWSRQVLEGSVYAVCGVLTAFLGGLGAGGLAVAALRRRGVSGAVLLPCFAGASGVLLFALPSLGTWLCGRELALTAATPAGLLAQALLGCCAALLPLTFCLGGVFPVAWEMVGSRAASEGRVLGTALAVNKLGAAAGCALGLFAVLPFAGLMRGTVLIGGCYLALAGLLLLAARRKMTVGVCGLAVAAAFGLYQAMHAEPVLGMAAGERALATYSGAYGPVAVVANAATGSRQILINGRQRLSGTRRALASQRHQSWVPLFFCRTPQRVLTIGMAAGISAAAALDFPMEELHAVELIPEVVTAAREQFGEWNGRLFSDPRAQVHVADGRVKLGQLSGAFDAIICDLFFPAEDGTASLYSRDFFEECRARLRAGGLVCLWLPCYQLTPQTAGIVVRTFADTFPCAIAVRANLDPLQPVIGLIGARAPVPMSDAFLAERLASPAGQALAARSPFFRSAEAARLLFVADLHAADPGFGAHPATTDDRPLFAYLGPRTPQGRERLYGFPLLEWIGKRALRPAYASCDLGGVPADRVQAALRAGNYAYAAAAASLSLPGDTRAESVRTRQVADYLHRAESLWPAAPEVAEACMRDSD